MKLALIFLLLFGQTAFAQTEKDSLEIVNVLKADYKAFGHYDASTHVNYCTEDYLLIENGEIWDLQKEVEYLKSNENRKSIRTDSFKFIKLRIVGEMAYGVYELHSKITENSYTKSYLWYESVVFRKMNGDWKIALIHSTKINE